MIRNRTFELVQKALTPENITRRITAESFNICDSRARKDGLNHAFALSFMTVTEGVKGNFRCFTGQHEDKQASMAFDREKGCFHCFGCMEAGKNLDVFDCISIVYDLKGFKGCYEKAVELFVDKPEEVVNAKGNTAWAGKLPAPMYKVVHNKFYLPVSDDENALQFLKTRGISKETAVRFHLRTWTFEDTYFIVFICDDGSVVRRKFATGPMAGTYVMPKPKYWNKNAVSKDATQEERSSESGSGYFNFRAIDAAKAKGEPVFIVEGAFDALSIEQVGFHAVALNSATKMQHFLKQTDYQDLIVLPDNDEAGRAAAVKARDAGFFAPDLTPETAPHLAAFKDANEALVAGTGKLRNDLAALKAAATAFYGRA